MIKMVSSGVESSSAWSPGVIPHPAIVGSSFAAPDEPPGFDEFWEPPTPAEWRRAVRIIGLQVVREILRGDVALRLLRAQGSSEPWH
jgi:hypothetical protein